MGNRHEVWGWTYGENLPQPMWYYKKLYRGDSLLAALWTALRARASYGCVKVELR